MAANRRSDSVKRVLRALFCILVIIARPTLLILLAAFTVSSTDVILGHIDMLGTAGLVCLQSINLLVLMTICYLMLFRTTHELGAFAWLIRAFLTAGIALAVLAKTFLALT